MAQSSRYSDNSSARQSYSLTFKLSFLAHYSSSHTLHENHTVSELLQYLLVNNKFQKFNHDSSGETLDFRFIISALLIFLN